MGCAASVPVATPSVGFVPSTPNGPSTAWEVINNGKEQSEFKVDSPGFVRLSSGVIEEHLQQEKNLPELMRQRNVMRMLEYQERSNKGLSVKPTKTESPFPYGRVCVQTFDNFAFD
eukprot:symbB.v1.2.004307.t1/scaffold244.1/size254010/2